MKRVTIIGLGLIGGSLGLALKKALGSGVRITGYARNPEVGRLALRRGAVDGTEGKLVASIKEADIVVLATPPLAIKEILKEIAPELPPGVVVTDVASTKSQILRWAEEYLAGRMFVGGHPMAGKETSGIEAAEADLFRGCTYCLSPAKGASREAVQEVMTMVRAVGAEPLFLDASDHDYLVAGISHLPLLLSVALAAATTQSPYWQGMAKLAATGYQDLTRLASGSPEMSRDICLTNRDSLLRWIDQFVERLSEYRQLIAEADPEIEKTFRQVREARRRWLASRGKV